MEQIAAPNPPPGLEIMKAGTHVSEDGRAFTFTDADLRTIAENYDPALFEAPLVVGHPKTEDPAYGWVETLSVHDGSLYAVPKQVEPQFAEMVNAGSYKKISPSIYLPDTPGNPKKGALYVKHIGFLGGAAPSIKGMRAASFNEADGDGEPAACFSMPLSGLGWTLTDLFQRFRDWLIDKEGIEAADRILPQWQIRSIDEHTRDRTDAATSLNYAAPPGANTKTETSMSNENNAAAFAEREQAITDKTAALDQREQAIAQREAATRRIDAADFAEQLVTDGKLLPRLKPTVIELLLALPTDAALNFAEGDKSVTKPAGEALRELLEAMPKALDYTEKSGDSNAGGLTNAASFAAPPGMQVDAAGLELHQRAIAYQAAHAGTSYLAAVKAVGG